MQIGLEPQLDCLAAGGHIGEGPLALGEIGPDQLVIMAEGNGEMARAGAAEIVVGEVEHRSFDQRVAPGQDACIRIGGAQRVRRLVAVGDHCSDQEGSYLRVRSGRKRTSNDISKNRRKSRKEIFRFCLVPCLSPYRGSPRAAEFDQEPPRQARSLLWRDCR